MKRTLSSGTHYDGGFGRGILLEPVGDASCKTKGLRRTDEEVKGGVEDAYEHALVQSMADALERAMDLSELRQERLARVMRAIEAGTYWVPAEKLARKLVRNMLGDY